MCPTLAPSVRHRSTGNAGGPTRPRWGEGREVSTIPPHHPASRRRAPRLGLAGAAATTPGIADTVPGSARITLRLPQASVDRLDGLAAERRCSRARAFQLLLEASEPPAPAPTSQRALALLAESAEAGSVQARVALARLLSTEPRDPVRAEIDEIARRRRAREQEA